MLIFVLFIIEILLLLLTYYIMRRDIFRPSILMIAMFTFSTFIAILNVINWNIDYLPQTIGILALGFLCAVIADYCMFYIYKNAGSRAQILEVLYTKHWKIMLVIFFDLVALILYYQEIRRLAILDGYVAGANLLWHFRNITSLEAEESVNGFVSLLIKMMDAFGYVFTFAFIQNFLSKKIKLKKYIIYIVPILLFAAKVLMGSGRQELLRWAAYTLVTSYILYQYRYGWKKSISSKYIRRALVIMPVALILFYLATNVIGRGTSRTFFQYISTYAGGSIQHFNQYIMDPSLDTETHFGAETFPGIYSFLNRIGLTDYTRSVHLEMRRLGVTQGNIYTFFRRPYHDFGLFGMCLMTFLVVLAFSWKYSSFKTKKLNRKTNYSIICYGYLFYWIVLASIENYSIGSISLGTVMTLILVKFAYVFLFGMDVGKGKIKLKI